MLNKWLYILSVVILLSGFQTVSAETNEQRIQFAKGKTSTVVKGMTGENGVYYTVRGKGGQNLIVELTPSSKIGIKIEADQQNGHMVLINEEKGGNYEVVLEETGDYTIFIGSLDHKSTPFELSIKIPKTETKGQRIEFAKGKISTVVKGVTGESGVYYTIKVKGGHALIVDLTPSEKIEIKIEMNYSFGHEVLLDEKKGGHHKVDFQEPGDCTIFINSTEHKSIPFELNVKFEKSLGDI